MLNKKELAAQLKEAGQLLDVLGTDSFRAKAFTSAARSIENYDGDIAPLLEQDRMTSIRGIGKSLAQEFEALKEQDVLPVLAELYLQVPESVRSLFTVSGLGAKKIAVLWQEGVDSLEGLIVACDSGQVAALKGFGKKSADKFKDGAIFALAARIRMRLNVAADLSQEIHTRLEEALPQAHIEIAGELRRRCETVGALEFLFSKVSLSSWQETLQQRFPELEALDASVFQLTLGHHTIILRHFEADVFGAKIAFHTGSDTFFVGLQQRAEERGLVLNEAGLFQEGELLVADCEAPLFEALDLPWIYPELREEACYTNPDNYLQEHDIHGLVHNHSTWSDAVFSISEMVEAALERGYNYLAMADHSQNSYVAQGLSPERVLAQAKEVASIREELSHSQPDFGLLHGMEVDIHSDGRLDYDDDLLAQLDYCVISVHQNFNLSQAAQTERIVKAIHNPYASILGHATGRLLLRRPSYAVDLQAVIEACAETGTIIEINASPYRLDMDWRWVKKAKALGCKFSINPDAHHTDGFDDVKYGVWMGRKAGLSKDDVVNTALSAEDFLAQLKHH